MDVMRTICRRPVKRSLGYVGGAAPHWFRLTLEGRHGVLVCVLALGLTCSCACPSGRVHRAKGRQSSLADQIERFHLHGILEDGAGVLKGRSTSGLAVQLLVPAIERRMKTKNGGRKVSSDGRRGAGGRDWKRYGQQVINPPRKIKGVPAMQDMKGP